MWNDSKVLYSQGLTIEKKGSVQQQTCFIYRLVPDLLGALC